jgi:RND family efflux transporter MFP subunit
MKLEFFSAGKFATLMLAFGLAVAAVSGSSADAQEMPPALVFTEEVRNAEFHDQVALIGRTEALKASRIVSEVSGRVARINAKEGTWLNAGEPLVTLDADRLQLAYNAKAAEARQAETSYELAGANLERTQRLFAGELIRQTTLDSAVAWAALAEAGYHRLRAETDGLELDLEKSVIRALYSGFTGRKLIDVGEWVDPGTPVYEMVDLAKVRVRVDLPEKHFGRVQVGSPVTITASNAAIPEIEGSVVGISPNANSETHTFPVTVEVDNSDGLLGGGMLVRATLNLDETYASLAVPKDAIVRQGMQTLVYAVVDGQAQPINVMTTSANGSLVAVQSEGLTEGMQVVVRGNERIFPGSKVRIGNAESDGATPPGAATPKQERSDS